MKTALSILFGLLLLSYPIAVYFGLNYFEPKTLAVFLLCLLLLRQFINPLAGSGGIVLVGVGAVLVAFTILSNDLIGLRFYPVLVSCSLLATFSYSLHSPPTVIERIARLTDPDLDQAAVAYTRTVTKIWCAFFIGNGLLALYTALFASMEAWTLYNGLLSYLLMGLLFAGEFLYRKLVLKV